MMMLLLLLLLLLPLPPLLMWRLAFADSLLSTSKKDERAREAFCGRKQRQNGAQ
jgi:hypothetical protein